MLIKIPLIAEIEAPTLGAALEKLDSFRESVLPMQNYSVFLYQDDSRPLLVGTRVAATTKPQPETIAQNIDSPTRKYHLTYKSRRSGSLHRMSFGASVARDAWIAGVSSWADIMSVYEKDQAEPQEFRTKRDKTADPPQDLGDVHSDDEPAEFSNYQE